MTDTQSASNAPVAERWDRHNVIAVSFAYDDTAAVRAKLDALKAKLQRGPNAHAATPR